MALRPRVFISSVIEGYSDRRDAAGRGIVAAGCEAVRSENFPAAGASPRTACLDGVASCDGNALILGERYGFLAPSGLSVTEEEYDEAKRLHKRIFVFVEKLECEASQKALVDRVQDYVGGHWRKSFSTVSELEALVTQAVREADLSTASGTGNAEVRLERAFSESPGPDSVTWLKTVWVTDRDEEVIDPLLLGESVRQRALELGHSGNPPLLDYTQAKSADAGISKLVLNQGATDAWRDARDLVTVEISSDGTLAITTNVTGLRPREFAGGSILADLHLIIREDVERRVQQSWAFASAWWNDRDPYERHAPLLFDARLFHVDRRRFVDKSMDDSHGVLVSEPYPENPARILDAPRLLSRADLPNPTPHIERITEMLRRRMPYGRQT